MKIKTITVTGKGNSLWCDQDKTKNVKFKVNEIELNNMEDGSPYEVQAFGPKTEWYHYTDSGIENELSKKLLPVLKKAYPDYNITGIGWSEQGMQPEGGWSFDIDAEPKKKSKKK